MRLLVYVDYIAQIFSVANSEPVLYKDLDMKNGEELVIPIKLSMDKIDKDKSHRLNFILISSPQDHAKDRGEPSASSFDSTYQLYFGKYDENIPCYKPEGLSALEDTEYYENENGAHIVLNTNISNLKDEKSKGLFNPEVLYEAKKGSEFSMNCCISNTTEPAEEAIVFLTLDNKPAKINGQDFILVNLDKSKVSVSNIKFDLPNDETTVDVIGYVMFSPFENLIHSEKEKVQDSARFSISTVSNQ